MTTSECEFGAGMGKSAVDYLYDFIIEATRLSPEEQEVWNMLCRKRGGDIFCRERRQIKKNIWRRKKRKEMNDTTIFNTGFNPILLKEDTEPLTTKENEVLNLLMLGFNYDECSKMLVMSVTTVKTHVVHIFQKKQVSTLQQLLVKCYNPQLSESGNIGKFNKNDVLEIRNILGG